MSLWKRIRQRLARTPLRKPLVHYRHRNVRPGDLMIASYPRSGSTWLRFLLFDLLSGASSSFEAVNAAIPDVGQAEPQELLPGGDRVIKTHEPYYPVYHRAIYLVRDVRDVMVSEYFFQTKVGRFQGELSVFLPEFVRGTLSSYGSWPSHVSSWLDSGLAETALCVVRYEDLRAEPEATLGRIGRFLGLDWESDRLRRAIADNSLQRMQDKEQQAQEEVFRDTRKDVRFIRKGRAGGWAERLTAEQIELLERACGSTMERVGYSLHRAGPTAG